MRKIVLSLLTVAILLGVAGCTQVAAAQEIKSNKPRISSPAVSQSDMTALVDGNTAFALDLYKSLKDKDGNLFYSPYSISEALAMTYGGARGNTANQMANTLHFQLPESQLNPAFNSLDQQLASRGKGAAGQDQNGFRLHVVNAIWGQQGFAFLPGYLDLLAQNYGAGLRVVDFKKSPEPARQAINQWVADQTEQKIKDLLPQGSVDELTRLVLTNAIYFNAAWAYQFEKFATADGKFTMLNGNDVNASFMNQTEPFGFYAENNLVVVELPYDGRELSMVVIMPDSGNFSNFEAGLNTQQLKSILGNIKYQQVELSMPKFKFDSEFELKQQLASLGMTDAFNASAADFSGMDGNKDLLITDVVHKAYVSVDETGTEAAAATGVVVGTTSIPAEQVKVTLNHPFIFLIRDVKTGAVLFIGRVLNPAG